MDGEPWCVGRIIINGIVALKTHFQILADYKTSIRNRQHRCNRNLKKSGLYNICLLSKVSDHAILNIHSRTVKSLSASLTLHPAPLTSPR